MIDYSIYYRRSVKPDKISSELPVFDIFVSSFNSSERVIDVFSWIRADRKLWLIHPEYRHTALEEPTSGTKVHPSDTDEVQQVNALLDEIGSLKGKSLCIDISGMMRHVIVFLVAKLAQHGMRRFTMLYSEPLNYIKHEHTIFSGGTSGDPRPVRGMFGSPASQAKDYLIIAVGYDHKLIAEVANQKDNATVFPIFAFPSLSPDMYQQSAIRAADSGEITLRGHWNTNRRFAPANDPFSTASVVSGIVQEIDKRDKQANTYLSPLSTKAQALGMGLYWQLEGRHRGAVTMLLPECLSYTEKTTSGIRRLWEYTIEI